MNESFLQSLLPPSGKPVKILFVCLGNICRSPAAEGILQHITKTNGDEQGWVIDSAGIGGYNVGRLPDNRMRIHARKRGYELTHICRRVSHHDFEAFDIIIAMDANNEDDLRQMAQTVEEEKKIILISRFIDVAYRYDYVPDPYYEGAEGFELVLDLLENACANLYDQINQFRK